MQQNCWLSLELCDISLHGMFVKLEIMPRQNIVKIFATIAYNMYCVCLYYNLHRNINYYNQDVLSLLTVLV